MLKSNPINFQFSIFGEFTIHPTPDNITKIMSSINAISSEVFLPNIVNLQQVELPANKVINTSNIGFVSESQKYNIAFLRERIDFNVNPDQEFNEDDFYDLSTKILQNIMTLFSLKSNRLAINMQLICELSSRDHVQKKGKELIKSPDYYNACTFSEWSFRVNSQSNIDLGEKKEMLNVITDVSSTQTIKADRFAVICSIDINTLAQNIELRFCSEQLSDFSTNIKTIAATIKSDFEGMICNE